MSRSDNNYEGALSARGLPRRAAAAAARTSMIKQGAAASAAVGHSTKSSAVNSKSKSLIELVDVDSGDEQTSSPAPSKLVTTSKSVNTNKPKPIEEITIEDGETSTETKPKLQKDKNSSVTEVSSEPPQQPQQQHCQPRILRSAEAVSPLLKKKGVLPLSVEEQKLLESDVLTLLKRFSPKYYVPTPKTWSIPKSQLTTQQQQQQRN